MFTKTTERNAVIPGNIPEQLTERPQWVCWRYEEREGKQTKVPYSPEDGSRASTTDLMTWSSFERAFDAYMGISNLTPVRPYDGIGFVFSSGDPLAGIDIDNCRDPESGEVSGWAQKIIDDAHEGYVEVSPSGTGVHIIIEGRVRDGGVRKGRVEMYSRERYFTITGVLL